MAIRDRKEELWDPAARARKSFGLRELLSGNDIDSRFGDAVMLALPVGGVAKAADAAAAKVASKVVPKVAEASGKWSRTIWPTVGKYGRKGAEFLGEKAVGAGKGLWGFGKGAAKAAIEPAQVAYRAVVPGPAPTGESIWKTVIFPHIANHKTLYGTTSAASAAIGVGTSVKGGSEGEQQAETTKVVKAVQSAVDQKWDAATNAALRASLTDASAMKHYVSGIRDAMESEVRFDARRGEQAVKAASDAIDAVKGSKAWNEAAQASMSEYVVNAKDPDNYEAEYRDKFKDPASQMLGEDFFRVFRKGE